MISKFRSGADLALVQREAQSECIRQAIEEGKALIVNAEHYDVCLSPSANFSRIRFGSVVCFMRF